MKDLDKGQDLPSDFLWWLFNNKNSALWRSIPSVVIQDQGYSAMPGGKLLKNNKPSQLDPLPVIIGASSQQRIWGKKNPEFWTKMRYWSNEKCGQTNELVPQKYNWSNNGTTSNQNVSWWWYDSTTISIPLHVWNTKNTFLLKQHVFFFFFFKISPYFSRQEDLFHI